MNFINLSFENKICILPSSMNIKHPISLVRYKKDLRIADHKPLYEACQQNFSVVALYVREPHIMQGSDYSHFHQYRIQESLKDLKSSLKKLNIPLLMIHGEMTEALDQIQNYYTIDTMYAHEETGNNLTYQRDLSVIRYCQSHKFKLIEYPHNGVVRRLQSRDSRSPIQRERMSQPLIDIPEVQTYYDFDEQLILYAKQSFVSFVAAKKPSTWSHQRDQPGETSAHVRLSYFLTHAGPYRYALSRPEQSVSASSRLSWYLTYGNLSAKQIHQATFTQIKYLASQPNKSSSLTRDIASLNAFYQRLFWRCHFIQKLESQSSIEYHNQNKAFDTIRTETNHDLIQARYHGQTGIPMIDAGMRCLHATGWINFRMRATLTSFICNTCMQPWQAIWPMLAKLFLDYEPGIHYSQLQMQSGTTGINTIRIYNPLKQIQEKDSDLTFVRRWIPEIVWLDHEEIFQLGTETGNILLLTKSINYPSAIIDIITANRLARIALRWVKKTDESKTEAQKVYNKLWSRKKSTRKTSRKDKPVVIPDNLFS